MEYLFFLYVPLFLGNEHADFGYEHRTGGDLEAVASWA